MSSRGTKNRNVRAEDELWNPCLAKAQRRGETISDVLRRALKEYRDTPDDEPPMK